MAAAKTTAAKKNKSNYKSDRRPAWKPKLCCCPPRIALTGSTTMSCCPLNSKMFDDKQLLVRADANASVNPPGGPQVNADGSGGSEARNMLRKDVDLITVTVTYSFDWEVTADCDFAVRVLINGQVQADYNCAPKQGHVELSASKVVTWEELNTNPRESATAFIEAVDCAGLRSDCAVTLNEP